MDRIADALTDRAIRALDRPLSRRGFLGRAVRASVAFGIAAAGLRGLAHTVKASCCVHVSCNSCPTGLCTTGCCPSGYSGALVGTCCETPVEKGCWACTPFGGGSNCGCEVLTGNTC